MILHNTTTNAIKPYVYTIKVFKSTIVDSNNSAVKEFNRKL